MTGSLQIKNGKFYIVLNIYENGKRKMKWISTGLEEKGNKRKADQMLREKLQTYEPFKPSAEMPFADYIRHWMESVERKVDAVTYQGYQYQVQAHILPYFDSKRLKLCEIDAYSLQSFFDEKATNGRKDGNGGLSPASLRRLKNPINQTLNDAVKNGLLATNPCQFVVLPKATRFEAKFYTAQQLQTLFTATQDDPLAPLIHLAALYGLRRSEILGLKWDSIDIENGLLTIKHTVAHYTTTVAKDKTKTASSHRSFPLTNEAIAIFQEARRQEEENRIQFGKAYAANDYIFKWADGTPFAPSYVSHHFKLLLKKHNLPPIRFHELRHSCASLLLNNGFTLKDVQEWMGHSDITMTANIYGHLDNARKQTMADNLSHLLT